jgi:hypothetical protein
VVPYAGHYVLPGYAAQYAPVYQPYAASYGYYSNPAYVGATGAVTHSQYHAQDEIGQYNYGYTAADSSKSEVKTADGIVHGTYSYVDANGILQVKDMPISSMYLCLYQGDQIWRIFAFGAIVYFGSVF